MATTDHVDDVEVNKLNVDKQKVVKAIQAIYKQHALKQEKRKNLLGESQKIFLLITLWKVPVRKNQRHRILVPHSLQSKECDVCLITKDERKMDRDQSGRFYENLLAQKGVKNITHVMSLQKLRKEYRPFEVRRQLVRTYDIFLADARIFRLVDTCTGKEFHRKNKYPVAVSLTKTDLATEINRAIDSAYFTLIGRGSSSSFAVANTDMPEDHVVENIMAAIDGMMVHIPQGWRNVKCLYVKSERSLAIPLYATLECQLPLGVKSLGKNIDAEQEDSEDISNLEEDEVTPSDGEESETILSESKESDVTPSDMEEDEVSPPGSEESEVIPSEEESEVKVQGKKRKQTTGKQTVTKKTKNTEDKSSKIGKKDKPVIEKKTRGTAPNKNKVKTPKSKLKK